MKSSKRSASPAAGAGALELTSLPSPADHRPVTKTKSHTENSLASILHGSKENANPVDLPRSSPPPEDGSKPQGPTGHKMSVQLPAAPSVGSRSRLSSFNLPLFAAGTKPMNIFTAHKRRGSLGKALQKNSKVPPTKTEGGAEEVIIDMEEQSREIEALAADVSGLIENETGNTTAIADSIMSDLGGGILSGGLISPLDRSQESTKKTGRHTSGSSAVGRVSLQDEKQSKISLTDSMHKGPDALTPRAMEHGAPDDAADLQRTERNLLTLLDDFNAGRLKAFGSSDTSIELRRVREMQERLARSHFDMYALQEKIGFDNPKLSTLSLSNWQSLMGGMQELTEAVHRLGTSSKVSQSSDSQVLPPTSEESSHDRLDTSASITS